jgi:hypothetical protein
MDPVSANSPFEFILPTYVIMPNKDWTQNWCLYARSRFKYEKTKNEKKTDMIMAMIIARLETNSPLNV